MSEIKLFGAPVEIKNNDKAQQFLERVSQAVSEGKSADVKELDEWTPLRHAAAQAMTCLHRMQFPVARYIIDGQTIQAFAGKEFGDRASEVITFEGGSHEDEPDPGRPERAAS